MNILEGKIIKCKASNALKKINFVSYLELTKEKPAIVRFLQQSTFRALFT